VKVDIGVEGRVVACCLDFFGDRGAVREGGSVLATPDAHSKDAAAGDFRVEGRREEQVLDLLAPIAVALEVVDEHDEALAGGCPDRVLRAVAAENDPVCVSVVDVRANPNDLVVVLWNHGLGLRKDLTEMPMRLMQSDSVR
jgi:hypothetical protein